MCIVLCRDAGDRSVAALVGAVRHAAGLDAAHRGTGTGVGGGTPGRADRDVAESRPPVSGRTGDIRCGVEVGKDITIAALREQGYKGFYVAIGCQGGRLPGIPGETLEGTTTAIDFLHDANCGLSTLNSQLSTKKVVVVGGGNVAIDAARVAMRSGASEVSISTIA